MFVCLLLLRFRPLLIKQSLFETGFMFVERFDFVTREQIFPSRIKKVRLRHVWSFPFTTKDSVPLSCVEFSIHE